MEVTKMNKILHDYTSLITDLAEMINTNHGISEQSFKTDLRLLNGPFPELAALKRWVVEQKEPLTHDQMHLIRDDLLNQLYQLYKSKKLKSYPFSVAIFEEFMNRDLRTRGEPRALLFQDINHSTGISHYTLEAVAN
jgi:hypothetical protein